MTIRAGDPGIDEERCVALWLAALQHRDGFAPPADSRDRAHAKFRGEIVRFGIAETPRASTTANDVTAIATDSIDGFALTVRDSADTALLELIAVTPRASGAGTGRALLDDAVAFAAASGYRNLDLWVRRGNERAAALYVSRHFEATGGVEPHPLGGEPMLHFRRALA